MASQPTPRQTDDVTHWCGNVFEAFALTVEDVVDCHDVLAGEDVGTAAGLVRAARSRPETFPDPVTFVRDTLIESDRGVDAPVRYWANAPEVHLDALFAPFGCRVTVEWRRDDTRRIVLEDADGTEFRATLTYPDTPLEQDNYPALLDTVNRDLLAGTGVELVLLNAPCRRWQYALGETAALDNLRRRYGETVRFGNRRLLAQSRPGDYVPGDDGDVPVPDWATDSRDDPHLGLSLGAAAESFAELVERIDRSTESFADVDPEAARSRENTSRERATPAGDVAALLDDLSGVWPPTVANETAREETASTPVLGSSSESQATADHVEAIDDLFRRLERDVASKARDDADDDADRTRASDPDATPEDIAVEECADSDDHSLSDNRDDSGECPSRSANDDRSDGVDGRPYDIDETIGRSEFQWVEERRLGTRSGGR